MFDSLIFQGGKCFSDSDNVQSNTECVIHREHNVGRRQKFALQFRFFKMSQNDFLFERHLLEPVITFFCFPKYLLL